MRRTAFVVALTLALAYETPTRAERARPLDAMLSDVRFDLAAWIARAAWDKTTYEFRAPHRTLDEAERVRRVRAFLRGVDRADKLEAAIAARYADPREPDPQRASAALRAERDDLLRRLDAERPIVEAILQEQAEAVLREEDFGIAGQPLPPLRFRLTPLPHILIVSRRDRIERVDQRELAAELSVDAFDRIERDVDARFDVASLVTPIGGYATYPTMLPETASLRFIVETSLHEWTHNYLLFSWVGLNYERDPVARTINETTAAIVQRELGERVLRRFYPEETAAAELATDARRTARAAAFDFNKEMRATRVRVDALLAAGRVDEAERYMEQRRADFVAAGYGIRKLNQAWFAFYGAYNDAPGGAPAAGNDPVGPAVQALRARSPSVGAFVRAVAQLKVEGNGAHVRLYN
jgi:hypothetical protein